MNKYVRYWDNRIKNAGYEHRKVWENAYGAIPDGLVIDHINGKKDDNRIENLQLLTRKKNDQRSTWSQGYRYIKSKSLTRNYQAFRVCNSVGDSLGMFGTPCGAKMAYNTFFIGGNK